MRGEVAIIGRFIIRSTGFAVEFTWVSIADFAGTTTFS